MSYPQDEKITSKITSNNACENSPFAKPPSSAYKLDAIKDFKRIAFSAMPFQPGQSGNPGGGVREKRFYTTLDRAIKQEDAKRLRDAAEKLLDLAAAGEPWAVQMLADRLDGKPAQQVQLSGDAEQPVVQRIEQVIVDPQKP